MSDMDKVIKDLEEIKEYIREKAKDLGSRKCRMLDKVDDAIAMLKEQEPVEPYIAGSGESFETAETWWYECGNCNKPIDPNDKFCRHCGRKVKWE